MVLPSLLSWMRRLSVKGRHYYNPDAHTDLMVGIGGVAIDGDVVLKCVSVAGVALIIAGGVGLWREMH